MYIRNYPEDSVLRRHYEAAAELKRRRWRQKTPEDSVLRRHHAQLARSGGSSPGPRVDAAKSRTGGAAVSEMPARQPAPAQGETQAKGFFGWLGRLFGGQ